MAKQTTKKAAPAAAVCLKSAYESLIDAQAAMKGDPLVNDKLVKSVQRVTDRIASLRVRFLQARERASKSEERKAERAARLRERLRKTQEQLDKLS